jgi:hypothetical protein
MDSLNQNWPLIDFIQAIYEAPTYHILLEAILFIWVLWLLFRKSYKPKVDVLTEQVSSQNMMDCYLNRF